MTGLLCALFVLMIIAAVAAVLFDDLLSAVIAMGALGFAAGLTFITLRAPDVEITMRAVEVLALIIYICATLRRDVKTVSGTRDVFGAAVAVVLIAFLCVFMLTAARDLPEFGRPVMERNADAPSRHYIAKSLEETGAPNAVAGVLLDYRGYDTLGEATVLFASVLGAMTLLRTRARRRSEGERSGDGGGA